MTYGGRAPGSNRTVLDGRDVGGGRCEVIDGVRQPVACVGKLATY